jgi:hypothetical protein
MTVCQLSRRAVLSSAASIPLIAVVYHMLEYLLWLRDVLELAVSI